MKVSRKPRIIHSIADVMFVFLQSLDSFVVWS